MEALAAVHLAPTLRDLRFPRALLPAGSLSWIRLEFVLLTGALIMAG